VTSMEGADLGILPQNQTSEEEVVTSPAPLTRENTVTTMGGANTRLFREGEEVSTPHETALVDSSATPATTTEGNPVAHTTQGECHQRCETLGVSALTSISGASCALNLRRLL
jgi:hypothetical protein